jgi:hypothetical protein
MSATYCDHCVARWKIRVPKDRVFSVLVGHTEKLQHLKLSQVKQVTWRTVTHGSANLVAVNCCSKSSKVYDRVGLLNLMFGILKTLGS